MVRALLEGRKTQTRRIVKEPRWAQPGGLDMYFDDRLCAIAKVSGCLADVECPHGKPGDRLWVKETWTGTWAVGLSDMHLCFAADGSERFVTAPIDYVLPKAAEKPQNWVTPLFMPRWASRTTLDIAQVRVQRLQDITEEDAIAEGAEPWKFGPEQCLTSGERGAASPYRSGYACLWDEINADRATWKSNPRVWAITFPAVQA